MTWKDYVKAYKDGSFVPEDWNWCINEDAIRDREAEGVVFNTRICIYIMGEGGSQCEASFVTKFPCTPWGLQLCRNLITRDFGITRILNGVG